MGTRVATQLRQPCRRTKVLLYLGNQDIVTVEHTDWQLGGKGERVYLERVNNIEATTPRQVERTSYIFLPF